MVSALKRRFSEKKWRFAVMHQNCDGACGGVAFLLSKRPSVGDMLMEKDAMFPDGSKPRSGEKIVCGTCKQPIRMLNSEIDVANIETVQ